MSLTNYTASILLNLESLFDMGYECLHYLLFVFVGAGSLHFMLMLVNVIL